MSTHKWENVAHRGAPIYECVYCGANNKSEIPVVCKNTLGKPANKIAYSQLTRRHKDLKG